MKKNLFIILGTLLALSGLSNISQKSLAKAEASDPQRDLDIEVSFDVSNIKQYTSTSNPGDNGLLDSSLTNTSSSSPFSITTTSESLTVTEKEESSNFVAIYIPFSLSLEVPAYQADYQFQTSFILDAINLSNDSTIPFTACEFIILDEGYGEMDPVWQFSTNKRGSEEEYRYTTKYNGEENSSHPINEQTVDLGFNTYNFEATPIEITYKYGLFIFANGDSNSVKQVEYTLTLDTVILEKASEAVLRIVESDSYLSNNIFNVLVGYLRDGETIQLLKDVEFNIDKNLTSKSYNIDLNGHTLTTSYIYSDFPGQEITISNGTLKGKSGCTTSLLNSRGGSFRILNSTTVDMSEMNNSNGSSLATITRGGSLYLGAGNYILKDDKPCIYLESQGNYIQNLYIMNSNFIHSTAVSNPGLINLNGNSNLYFIGSKTPSEILISEKNYDISLRFEYNSQSYTGNPINIRYGETTIPSFKDVLFKNLDGNCLSHLNFVNLTEGTFAKYISLEKEIVLSSSNVEFVLTFHLNNETNDFFTIVVNPFAEYTIGEIDFEYKYHILLGWGSNKDLTEPDYNGTFVVKSNLDLYAIWELSFEDQLDYFIGYYLHFDDIDIDDMGTGLCLGENGYYAKAREYYLYNLSYENKIRLAVGFSEKYEAAKERFQTWASFNGEYINFDNHSISSGSKGMRLLKENNSMDIIVVSILGTSLITAIGYSLYLKKKKNN